MEKVKISFLLWWKKLTAPRQSKVITDGRRVWIIRLYQSLNVDEILPRKHPRIFQDYDNGFLQMGRYCALELPSFINFLVRRSENDPQAKVLLSSPIPESTTPEELLAHLDYWKRIFNICFFGGCFPDIEIILEDMHPSSAAYTLWSPTRKGIRINPKSALPPGFSGTYQEFCLSALLHEMMHAFTLYFSCLKRSCCGSRYSIDASCGGMGYFGHGPCYLDSLLTVSDSLRRNVDWPVDTLLESSAKLSMFEEDWQPEIAQLGRWGLDPRIYGDVDVWGRF